MDRHALLSLYRSLARRRTYAVLNIGGLAVGIAVFIVLALYVRFETSFERWLPNHGHIYKIESRWDVPDGPFQGVNPLTAGGLLDMLREDFPHVLGTRITTGGKVFRDGIASQETIARVDPSFFRVFQLRFLRGDARVALRRPSDLVLTAGAARRWFGTANPVGKFLTISEGREASPRRITAIVEDLPKNSDFDFTMLTPLKPPSTADQLPWRSLDAPSVETWLRFETPGQARDFAAKLPAFVGRHGRDLGPHPADRLKLPLTPLVDVHLAPTGNGNDSRRLTVITLGIVGALTLLIAIVNYVNLAIAYGALRAREVAMRKVLGGSRAQLVRQFLGEAMLAVALAALSGLILAELGLPMVNAAGGLTLSIPYGTMAPALVAVTAAVGLLAGFYPAMVLSRLPAAAVLASSTTSSGGTAGMRLREALVVFQFTMAIAFMTGTLVLWQQMRHVRATDLGFERQGLLIVPPFSDLSLTSAQRASMVAAFREIPGVTSVAGSTMVAGGGFGQAAEALSVPGVPGDGPILRRIEVGPDFFATYRARLLAGRVFDERYGGDDSTKVGANDRYNIVISRKAGTALGFASPQAAIGRTIGGGHPRTIVGVVDDMRYLSPRVAVDPTFYVFNARMPQWPMASLRVHGDPTVVREAIRNVWRHIAPAVPFDAQYADRRLAELYQADDQATRLFTIGSILSILIGSVGLWGLASFNTAQRTREIGIRKTLGASTSDILTLLVGQSLRPILVANFFAWPLAFVAMRIWLAGFDDRISLSPLPFLGAGTFAMALAALTVLGQALRASRVPPADALRHE